MPPAVRRVLALIAAAALLATACGDGGATPTTQETVPAPTVTEAPAGGLPEGFDIQGHRGARGLRPENTLPGFELALDLGVSTLELDLHLSADGEIVVWHDPVLDDEKCGIGSDPSVPDPGNPLAKAELAVRALTAAQLRSYDCSHNPGGFPDQVMTGTAIAGSDYGIVTLGEVFDFVEAYASSDQKTEEQRANAALVGFNIETKRKESDPDAIGDGFDGTSAGPFEEAVLAAVVAAGLVDRVVVQSFDHRSIWAILELNPQIRVAALTNRDRPDLPGYAERGASIWSPRFSELTDERLAEAHSLGIEVIPWTVNEIAVMQDLIDRGVDGLITDRPDIAAALR